MDSHPKWQPMRIAELLRHCGRNALAGRVRNGWSLKSDGSLVTALDVRNEMELKARLTEMLPGSFFLGEETLLDCTDEYVSEAFAGDCWVVDPIDGTAPFANGFPFWGVSIGLMRQGVLMDGGIILPEERLLMVTDGGSVLCARDVDVMDEGCAIEFSPLEPVPGGWDDGRMVLLGQEIARRYTTTAGNPVMVTGSAVQAVASVLLGRGLVYVGTVKVYDIAGVFPMIRRLGMEMRFLEGGDYSLEITDKTFHLQPGDPQRWKIRGTLTVGAGEVLDVAAGKLNLERH